MFLSFEKPGQPSKMVTLRALTVLSRLGRAERSHVATPERPVTGGQVSLSILRSKKSAPVTG